MSESINTAYMNFGTPNVECHYPDPTTRQAKLLHKQVRQDILDFAKTADAFAQKYLEMEVPQSVNTSRPEVVHHHHHHNDGFWFWAAPRETVVINNCPNVSSSRSSGFSSRSNSSSSSKDSDDNTAFYIIAGMIALVVGLITVSSAGTTHAEFNNEDREIEETLKFKAKLLEYRNLEPRDQELVVRALKAIELKEKMCIRNANSKADDWQYKATLITGCGLVGTGAVVGAAKTTLLGTFAAPSLVVGGAAAGVYAVAKMLFKSSVESASDLNARDAQELLKEAAVLRFAARQ